MRCPRDKMPLEESIFENDISIDTCSYCDGIWLDNEELGKLTGLKTDVLDGEKISEEIEWDEILKCPVCKIDMEKRYFSKEKTVKIDRCPGCFGIWLDTGEMSPILEIAYRIKDSGDFR
ncbi:MAG TPA: zf-TFIIB domain-containing protein [Candidatus Eremiobacteraeota bacterium]|nr:MAG: hypothetical protein BWY64_01597 [bacterium ADurb.Bin363]HPZ09750.1 zf-TFIIB domain-containing protein [Candidatus Eremiobacteraeota bacterium]